MDFPFPQTDLFSGSMLNFGGVSSENRWFNKWHLAGTFFERLLPKPTNVGFSIDFELSGYYMQYRYPKDCWLISSEGLTWDPLKKCQVLTGGLASLEWGSFRPVQDIHPSTKLTFWGSLTLPIGAPPPKPQTHWRKGLFRKRARAFRSNQKRCQVNEFELPTSQLKKFTLDFNKNNRFP